MNEYEWFYKQLKATLDVCDPDSEDLGQARSRLRLMKGLASVVEVVSTKLVADATNPGQVMCERCESVFRLEFADWLDPAGERHIKYCPFCGTKVE